MHTALVEALRASSGVVSRREHPDLNHAIDVAARRGEINRVLPSVYLATSMNRDWRALARAATMWNRDCTIVGEAAAALTFWRGRTPRVVAVAGVQARFDHRGFAFTRRVVPPELVAVRAGIRVAVPNLTAIDLAPESHGNSIDDALRARMATIHGMQAALGLASWRNGNTDRRRFLLDSRSEPWSSGERAAHQHLCAAGITRWHANVPIVCDNTVFYLDISMDDCPLVLEIDGRQHMDPTAFDYDRWRGNLLLLAGKHVLRFTTAQLDDAAGFIDIVRRARSQHGA